MMQLIFVPAKLQHTDMLTQLLNAALLMHKFKIIFVVVTVVAISTLSTHQLMHLCV